MKGSIRFLKHGRALSLEKALHCCAQSDHADRAHCLEFVYKRFFGYLFAITLRYVRNNEDAEELVNESFVKVFSKLDTFEGKGSDEQYEKQFKAWIARISVNSCIDFLRTKKVTYSLDDEDENEMDMPVVAASDSMDVEDILSLLYQLPDIQRSIFNLYEVEGYNHEEIGQMLGIPESTSRTYLTRAKQKLRKLYLEGNLTFR